MKEIGEKLKNAREEIGVSIEEASTDLKITEKQLEALENGDMDSFKDIINVKYLIRDYAKYLGLNKDDLVDDFNEYLFDYTSKITLEDIKEAKEIKEHKNIEKVRSPYTTMNDKKSINKVVVIVIIIMLLLVSIIGVAYYKISNNKKENVIGYIGKD